MSEHVLVLLMAANCGHCQTLKGNWRNYEEKIAREGIKLHIEAIHVPTTQSQIPDDYPKGLSVIRMWYPVIALIPRGEWDAAQADKANYVFKTIEVFNGKFTTGTLGYDRKYPRMTEDTVIQWIKESISKPEFQIQRSRPDQRKIFGHKDIPSLLPPGPYTSLTTQHNNQFGSKNGVCNMRIVPKK